MKSFHKFLDHTADVFFVAKGETLPDLFKECALAVEETMVEVTQVQPKKRIKIMGESHTLEGLLFDFLDEILFFKDYQQLMLSKFEIEITQENNRYHLVCFASGEKLDIVRHEPKVDVKAITMHEFKVEQVKDGWKAQVLIDI